jgi:hypothetical protein
MRTVAMNDPGFQVYDAAEVVCQRVEKRGS